MRITDRNLNLAVTAAMALVTSWGYIRLVSPMEWGGLVYVPFAVVPLAFIWSFIRMLRER
jgi:hypothetical protein